MLDCIEDDFAGFKDHQDFVPHNFEIQGILKLIYLRQVIEDRLLVN